MSSTSRHRDSFEASHALAFDARAGLSEALAWRIAEAVIARCPRGSLLELGAGTGEIGAHLARAPGLRYVGSDRSQAMLALFRGRLDAPALLLCFDADAPWPLGDARFDAVWMARVAHLVDPSRLAQELSRVLRPGGRVLIGRRTRAREHVRSVLRRELHALLRARGYAPRPGGGEALRLLSCAPGLVHEARDEVESWTVKTSPAQALAAWRDKPGLAGVDLPEAEKRHMLAALEAFARARFGADLSEPHVGHECFTLDVLRQDASTCR